MLPTLIPTPQITLGSTALPFGQATLTLEGMQKVAFTNPGSVGSLSIEQVADSSQPEATGGRIYGGDGSMNLSRNLRYNPGVDTWTQISSSSYSMLDEYGQGGRSWWLAPAGASDPVDNLRRVLHVLWVSGDPRFQIQTPLEVFARTTAPGYGWIQRWVAEDTSTIYGTFGSSGSFQLTPAANTTPLAISGYSVTGANAVPGVTFSGTWNTSGASPGVRLSFTDTSSPAGNRVVEVLVDASETPTTRIWSIDKAGTQYAARGFYGPSGVYARATSGESGAFKVGMQVGGGVGFFSIASDSVIGFADTNDIDTANFHDVQLRRGASGVLRLTNENNDDFNRIQLGGTTSSYGALARDGAGIKVIAADGTTGAHLSGVEQTAPAAPAANGYRVFAQDNGSGKTQWMILFGSGAAQQIAIEP